MLINRQLENLSEKYYLSSKIFRTNLKQVIQFRKKKCSLLIFNQDKKIYFHLFHILINYPQEFNFLINQVKLIYFILKFEYLNKLKE